MNKKANKKSTILSVIDRYDETVELQGNEFSRGIYACSSMARRLIGFCISNAYKDKISLTLIGNEEDEEKIENLKVPCIKSEFTFNEFFERMGMTHGENQIALVRNAVEECQRAVIAVENTPESYHAYSWFSESLVSKKTGKIKMVFNPLIFKALTEWYIKNKGYSAIKLDVLGKLKSFYAMRYYEIAISERGNEGKNGNESGQWFFQFNIEEIRTMFGIQPNEYKGRINNFTDRVIRIPIEELNTKNPDFIIEVIKIKTGRRVVGFRFLCISKIPNVLKIAKSDTYEEKQEKAESNDASAEIAMLKEKYPERFKRILENVKSQRNLPGLPRFAFLDEQEAAQRLREQLEEERRAKA